MADVIDLIPKANMEIAGLGMARYIISKAADQQNKHFIHPPCPIQIYKKNVLRTRNQKAQISPSS